MSTDFSAFSALSHAEVVADGVVALLKADTQIAAWTANDAVVPAPQIARMSDPLVLPDWPAPYVVVGPTVEERINQPSREAEVNTTISLWLVYEEHRDTVAAGEKTIASAVNRIISKLEADPLLDITTGSAKTGGIVAIARQSYQPIAPPEGSNDPVTMVMEVRVVYRYHVDAATGVAA